MPGLADPCRAKTQAGARSGSPRLVQAGALSAVTLSGHQPAGGAGRGGRLQTRSLRMQGGSAQPAWGAQTFRARSSPGTGGAPRVLETSPVFFFPVGSDSLAWFPPSIDPPPLSRPRFLQARDMIRTACSDPGLRASPLPRGSFQGSKSPSELEDPPPGAHLISGLTSSWSPSSCP